MPHAKDIQHKKGQNTGGQVENTLKQIPKIHMAIWCTDSIGQPGRGNQEKHTHNRAIYKQSRNRKGKWAKTIQRMQIV